MMEIFKILFCYVKYMSAVYNEYISLQSKGICKFGINSIVKRWYTKRWYFIELSQQVMH